MKISSCFCVCKLFILGMIISKNKKCSHHICAACYVINNSSVFHAGVCRSWSAAVFCLHVLLHGSFALQCSERVR